MDISVVHLERTDDLASTLDKLGWAKTNRVVLVWPDRGNPIENKVHLVRVLRKAEALGIIVGLVTQQAKVTEWATDMGVPVFDDLDTALSSHWRLTRRKGSHVLPRRSARKQKAFDHKLIEHRQYQSKRSGKGIFFLLTAVASILLGAFFLPSAEVTVSPRTMEQSLVIDIRSNPGIDQPNISGGLPVQTYSVVLESQADALSSGKVTIPDTYAGGAVEFQNITDEAVEVPAGTILVNSRDAGKRYATVEDLALPPKDGKAYAVPVLAITPGSSGNAEAGMINAIEGPVGLVAVVQNTEAVVGGSDSEAPTPSEADYDRLRQSMVEELVERAFEDVQGRLTPDQTLIADIVTIKEINEQRTPEIDQPSDRLRLTLKVEFITYAYMNEDLASVANLSLDANLPEGFKATGEPIEITTISQPSISDETVTWQIYTARSISYDFDKDVITRQITGKTKTEADRIITNELDLESVPGINIFPTWLSHLPFNGYRITWIIK